MATLAELCERLLKSENLGDESSADNASLWQLSDATTTASATPNPSLENEKGKLKRTDQTDDRLAQLAGGPPEIAAISKTKECMSHKRLQEKSQPNRSAAWCGFEVNVAYHAVNEHINKLTGRLPTSFASEERILIDRTASAFLLFRQCQIQQVISQQRASLRRFSRSKIRRRLRDLRHKKEN